MTDDPPTPAPTSTDVADAPPVMGGPDLADRLRQFWEHHPEDAVMLELGMANARLETLARFVLSGEPGSDVAAVALARDVTDRGDEMSEAATLASRSWLPTFLAVGASATLEGAPNFVVVDLRPPHLGDAITVTLQRVTGTPVGAELGRLRSENAALRADLAAFRAAPAPPVLRDLTPSDYAVLETADPADPLAGQ